MRDKSKRIGNKRDTRRLDNKSERQATRAAIRGDHVKQFHTDRWGHRPEPVALPDDATVIAPRGKTKGGKKCKRNKGGEHSPVLKYDRRYRIDVWRCERCDKILWGHNKPKKGSDHYLTSNIIRRLSGFKCLCPSCLDTDDQT